MNKRKGKADALVSQIKAVPYFSALDEKETELLANASCVVKKRAGELLFCAGNEAKHCFILQQGLVVHYFSKPNGKRFIIQAHSPGSIFFVSLSLAQTRHNGFLEVVEDATVVCIPAVELLRLTSNNPLFAQNLLLLTVNDNLRLNDTVNNFLVDARTRLCRYLFRRALESGKQIQDEIHLDLGMLKGDIAAALDLSPETLSRTMAQLKEEQILEVENTVIVIRSIHGLVQKTETL